MITNYDFLYKKIGYRFKEPKLLELALTHRSAGGKNNERLEFLGDSIINFIIADYLFDEYPKAKEGQLSRQRANFVKKDTLAILAANFDLGSFLHLGSGEMKSGGFRRESILANALEAVVGAMYLDSNFDECKACVNAWYQEYLTDIEDISGQKDPKTKLQEILQAQQKELPKYDVISIEGEAHSQTFKVTCTTELLDEPTEGIGSTRRKAEQRAAKLAIELIEKNAKKEN